MSTAPSSPENDANLSGLGRALLESKKGSKPSGPWVPPTAEELGKLLPEYDIVKMLGRGGMGAVYKGTQKSLDRPVAIKILSATLDESDQGFADRFKNEARALGKLKHPGIVGVYDFGTAADGLLYIVMEFIDGTDVARMIAKSGRLHTDHAMAITAHVCDALAYAHERGIIHRDIKPANIMVGYDGEVKVADFGLAKMTQSKDSGLTQSGMAMGTLHYMAPEALMLGSAVDHRADIYAMGVMLYQMLTGKLPQGMFELPSLQIKGLDPRYDGIIAKALREDREVRYQTILEMRTDLDAILTQPVLKVDANAGGTPALNTQARPQRPGGPHDLPSEPHEIERTNKHTSPWLWAALVAILALGVWEFLRKRTPAAHPPSEVLVEATPADAVKSPASPPTSAAPATAAVLPVPPTATASSPATATKDLPFVNSLGMKFVPVAGTKVLFCVHETQRQDYAAFAASEPNVERLWENQRKDGSPVGHLDDHPVVATSWLDAQAFCAWLSKKEGRAYRLPTDREWSYAVGIGAMEKAGVPIEQLHNGIKSEYPWGSTMPPPKGAGNFGDITARQQFPQMPTLVDYTDNFVTTAPVGTFLPNKLGIHDLGGNVWEWCQDWYDQKQSERVMRGLSWGNGFRTWMPSSWRGHARPTDRDTTFGFRCVIDLSDSQTLHVADKPVPESKPPPSSITPAAATKEKPFVNTLGMKFVSVPGTEVLFCIHETRYRDFAAYAVEALGLDGRWKEQSADGFTPTDRPEEHPVMRVSWKEAQGFCAWLSRKEGKTYRLPTDREWSLAVGIGSQETWKADTTPVTVFKSQTDFPWGGQWPPPPGSGNYSDESRKAKAPIANTIYLDGYDDGFPTTAPVMSFKSNSFGIYDLEGNVREWCEDSYDNANNERVLRGGCWFSGGSRAVLLSSYRGHFGSEPHVRNFGFRLVLAGGGAPSGTAPKVSQAATPPAPASGDPAKATNGTPFVNTLGMKFVPVPGTAALFCIHETRFQDYAAYAAASPGVDGTYRHQGADRYYPSGQTAEHPVMQVSWEDAQKFLAWLSQKEGKTYRLPTDREWSIAAGIGPGETWAADTTPSSVTKNLTAFPWGNQWPPPPGSGNYSDASRKARAPRDDAKHLDGYDDGFPTTAPVMSYPPNPFGLYDMGGNVWEYCADWYNRLKIQRVWRGGAWDSYERDHMLSSHRWHNVSTLRNSHIGFRCVLEISSLGAPLPAQSPPKP